MGEISRRYLATAVQTGVPFMLLDFYDDAIAADCVLSDNTSGSYTMTEHLISTGRRNIGFVGSVLSTSSIMGPVSGLRKGDAPCRSAHPGRLAAGGPGRSGQVHAVLSASEMPDAFVCNCDAVAYNLVETLKRNGYRVPQDVAVTGYDDYRYSTLCSPPAHQLPGGLGRHGKNGGGATAPPKWRISLPLLPPSSCPAAL